MCGIAGIFERSGGRVDPARLVAMTRTLIHRGPDAEGYFVNGEGPESIAVEGDTVRPEYLTTGSGAVGLGHRRLSIIDLSGGRQPLSDADGRHWVTFNGEIYGFVELRRELCALGYEFRTSSDTEVLVHAYAEWGDGMLSRLRGMFAFALWDEPQGRLLLARDRVGKKPLYYALNDRRLCFGSELKALLADPDLPRDVDAAALSDYLSLGYVPAPRSIFEAVKKLPAGHYAVCTRDSFEIQPYWDLELHADDRLTEDAAEETFLQHLDEATRLRMISDVPLGAFLSGGVDSSAVVSSMARQAEGPVVTNSIAFGESDYDERAHARRVAELLGTEHHEFTVTPEAVPVVETLAWHYDEPFADSSAVPTYYVSEMARRTVTVALSGDGGDEAFGGYRRYRTDARQRAFRRYLPSAVAGLLSPIAPKGRAFLAQLARDPVEAYCHELSAWRGDEKDRVLSPTLRRRLDGHRTSDVFRRHYHNAPADDDLAKLLYLDVKTYLCDDILVKVDRASMAVSLEVRAPLLDHELLEFAGTVPSAWKLRGDEGKAVMKRALTRRLPRDLLYRSKMGFGVPVTDWLRGELRDYARELILDGPATAAWLDRDYVARVWDDHQAARRDASFALWTLLVLNLWHRRFLGD